MAEKRKASTRSKAKPAGKKAAEKKTTEISSEELDQVSGGLTTVRLPLEKPVVLVPSATVTKYPMPSTHASEGCS